MATIKDVAKHAGVSTATVSLVINKNPRISPYTTKKVLKSIQRLGYYPTKSARDLVSRKTGNIGFILTDDHFLRTEPFYTRIFLGTEFQAREGEYYILLTTVKSNFNSSDKLPRFVLEKSVDGIIIAGKVPQNLIDRICELDIPIVFVDYVTNTNCCPLVLIDNIQGGIIATDHLIEMGHKNIAFVGGDIHHPSLYERLNGYKQALEKANIKINPNFIETEYQYPDRQNGFKAAKNLFKNNKNITAVFACNDAMAIGVMHYLKDVGYKIPEDISIIGFDDVEADLLLEPPLTTMRVPKIELGAEALKVMLEHLKNVKIVNRKILVPAELVIRGSTKKISEQNT